jgi:hypothetical protein
VAVALVLTAQVSLAGSVTWLAEEWFAEINL